MFDLTIQNVILNCPITKGVYLIFAYNSLNNLPIPIQRFAGIDESGLLYVGQSTKQSLDKRIKNFIRSSDLLLTTTNHSGGVKYRSNPIIRETLGIHHKLCFDFVLTQNPLIKEKEILLHYTTIFGEVPVLNG